VPAPEVVVSAWQPTMRKRAISFLLIAAIFLFLHGSALAQSLSFQLTQETIHVFWNEDGTESIDYTFLFKNETWGSPIDYVDIGLPSQDYELSSVFANVDGQPLTDIGDSTYVDYGIYLGLGADAIQPGKTGLVHAFIGTIRHVLYPDDQDKVYTSAVFYPTRFDSTFVNGVTDLTVTFHLPPGLKPEEPRWHSSQYSIPSDPAAGFDDNGRITYTWHVPGAYADQVYSFGASFPSQAVPAGAIVRPNPFQPVVNFFQGLLDFLPALGCFGFIGLIIWASTVGERRRKLQYLPPKISIEGHGIKRGLTSIEAAILMEQPMDKILTMILFSVIKKGAARVVSREPIKLEITDPLPEGLHEYETDFLKAFESNRKASQRKELQSTMVNLVKAISQKMKGFSRKETIAYYREIIERAWAQVEAADTPEVKSQKFDEVMEWTMLDRHYDDRTRRAFHDGPVFVPIWWGSYSPSFSSSGLSAASGGTGTASPSTPASLPHLPGSDFAASVVNGVQSFSSKVIGNVNDFTGGVTNQTNPVPKSSSSGGSSWRGGGGGGCACACACAGCACACAGGGR
jgi:hypothetical protein